MSITLNSIPVRVIGADLKLREATVEWEDGRVRLVLILKLRGTTGGNLEVARVCHDAARRQEAFERATAREGAKR